MRLFDDQLGEEILDKFQQKGRLVYGWNSDFKEPEFEYGPVKILSPNVLHHIAPWSYDPTDEDTVSQLSVLVPLPMISFDRDLQVDANIERGNDRYTKIEMLKGTPVIFSEFFPSDREIHLKSMLPIKLDYNLFLEGLGSMQDITQIAKAWVPVHKAETFDQLVNPVERDIIRTVLKEERPRCEYLANQGDWCYCAKDLNPNIGMTPALGHPVIDRHVDSSVLQLFCLDDSHKKCITYLGAHKYCDLR